MNDAKLKMCGVSSSASLAQVGAHDQTSFPWARVPWERGWQTRQNQCVRGIFFSHKRESAKIYYALLEILELNNSYEMKITLFAHKIQNDIRSIPTAFSKSITITPGMHQTKTSIG